jgi:hypothetical protein
MSKSDNHSGGIKEIQWKVLMVVVLYLNFVLMVVVLYLEINLLVLFYT